MKKYFEFNKPFQKFLPLFIIMVAMTLLLGTSYSMLEDSMISNNSNNYVSRIGNLEVTFFNQKNNELTISNNVPETDIEGIESSQELVFEVSNKGNTKTSYEIYLENENNNEIKFIYKKDNSDYGEIKNLTENNYLVQNEVLEPKDKSEFHVKAWLNELNNKLENLKVKVIIREI